MNYNVDVDVDEADVAVLNQKLQKSKELFTTISKSLNEISTRSSTASTKIKPILKDVNKLNASKKQVEDGLSLLEDVSNYAERTAEYESILSNPIESIGLKRFIDNLMNSKRLLKEMKGRIKNFKGIIINFEGLIDKSELSLQSHFQKLLNNYEDKKINDVGLIMKYFEKDPEYIRKNYIRIRGGNLSSSLRPYENITLKSDVPYEKGTNGLTKFVNKLVKLIDVEARLMNDITIRDIQIDSSVLSNVVKKAFDDNFRNVIVKYKEFLGVNRVINNESMFLELVENTIYVEEKMKSQRLSFERFEVFYMTFNSFMKDQSSIFRDLIKLINNRISAIERFSDKNIPEVTVELISKIRKMSDFKNSLLKLITYYKLGEWLTVKPPIKFMNVYTSVIPNASEEVDEQAPEYLLSCFFSDSLDCIMVNIEIGLKSDVSIKKSTQGFYLVKNLVMIETIVNRSQQLFHTLGNIGMERINKLKNRYLKLFLDDWNYASYIIIRDMTSITTTNAQSSHSSHGGMSSKEKEQVKELFKNFNESFDEALRNYERYNVTDTNLRTYLSNEIKKLIINAYFKLYDKYGNSDFTKNRSKYIKYDKQSFERLLAEKL